MKTQTQFYKTTISLFLLSIFVLLLTSCDLLTNKDDEQDDKLYVKFINAQSSLYTITNIQLQPMGKAGETSQPSGTWSDNILTNGATITPSGHEFFDLDIPNLNWSQYRLGVDDGSGNEIMLYLQPGYQSQWELPITHWGSDERTVSVTISYNASTELIYVTGYFDSAGIEEN